MSLEKKGQGHSELSKRKWKKFVGKNQRLLETEGGKEMMAGR